MSTVRFQPGDPVVFQWGGRGDPAYGVIEAVYGMPGYRESARVRWVHVPEYYRRTFGRALTVFTSALTLVDPTDLEAAVLFASV